MHILWTLPLFYVCLDVAVSLALHPHTAANEDDSICCIPASWEGTLYLDYGTVFIDRNTAFAYFNGSVHAAYSFIQKKVFFNITGFEQSPLIPKPHTFNTVLLYDFEEVHI